MLLGTKHHETKRQYKPNACQLGRHTAGGLFRRLEHSAGGISRRGTASLAGSAGRILCRARRLLRPPGRLLRAARCLLRPARARGARRGRGRRRIRRKVRRRLCRRRGRAGGGRGRRFLCPRGPLRNAGGAEREAEKEKAPPQGGLSAVSCHGHPACDRRAGGHRQSAGAKSG